MGKKDLQSVTASLASLAAQMPTQKPAASIPLKVMPSAVPVARNVQFSLDMRPDLRKQLLRLAADADMTARAFVLTALKEKGLDVQPEDLIDRRKQRG
jgi:hypothetical protein